MITIEKALEKTGLTQKETKVYLATLELGETNISRIAKKSGVKRVTTYWVIDSLKEKELISSSKRGNINIFIAEDPRKIEERIDESKRDMESVMPELLSFANLIDKKPKIKYFEGKNGIKEVYKDNLRYPNQEILAWFDESALSTVGEDYFINEYIPKRIAKKIWVRAIMPKSEKMTDWQKKDIAQLRKSKFASENLLKLNVEISIYGTNKVGLMPYAEEIGIIIESQKIHDSLKSIFETMWAILP